MSNLFGLVLSVIITYFAAIILWYALCVIGKWMMFNKMGEEGWKALIPFYSDYILYRDVWNTTPFWGVIALCLVSAFLEVSNDPSSSVQMLKQLCEMSVFVITMLMHIRTSRSFEHGYLFAFGLMFLNPLFTIILGLGQSRYIGNTSM